MKKYFILITSFLSIFLLLTACNYGPGFTHLSGEIVTDQRSVPDFNGIEVSSGIELILSQGQQQHVSVKADKDLQDEIRTVVRDGILKIYCEHSFWHRPEITVEVTFTNIDQLRASSGSNVKSTQTLNFDHLKFGSSSGCNVDISIKAVSVDLSSSSGANIHLEGSTDDLSINGSSGCNVKLQDLEADNVTINSSSGANIFVTANKSIDVDSSSGSNIYVKGNPQKQHLSTSSGANVHFR